jgi:MFS family permease
MRTPTVSRTHSGPLLLATLGLAQLLIGLDYNIVFVALPAMGELGFGSGDLQWVVSSYAIAFGGFLLLGGRLVDHLGRRRMFLAGVGLYALGSTLGGLASTPWLLVVGRAVQGLGGAALAPATLALLASGFGEGSARNRAFAVWGAAGSAGMVLGSILGGVLTEVFGWRAVFAVNLPIAALVIALARASVPADSGERAQGRIDVPGALLATAAAVLTVLGLTSATERGWASLPVLGCLLAAALAGMLLVVVERRTTKPLFDPTLLRHRHLVTGTASTFLFMAGFGATAYFLTLYLQQARGLTALQTGLAFVIPCVGVLIGTQVGGRMASRSLRSAMLGGQAVGLVGCLALALTLSATTPWSLLLGLAFLFSVGQGVTFTAMFATAATGSPDEAQGTVGGIATTGQQLGGAIGLAMLVSLVAGVGGDDTRVAFLGICGVIALGLLVALLIPATRQRRRR